VGADPQAELVTGRLLRRIAAVAAILGLVLLSGVTPAAAHDVLISSSPANGASVPAPGMVSFTFNDVVLNNFAALVVTGPDGKQYQDGTPRVIDTSVSVKVKELPVTGAYTASYRIVSADGHPVSGDIKFTVTTTKASPVDPNMPGVPSTASAVPGAGGGSITPYVIGGGIAILVLALGAVVLATRRRDLAAPVEEAAPSEDSPEDSPEDSIEDSPGEEPSEPAGKHSVDAAGSGDSGRTAE
jgi:methionine-rich copper-binding protein CopC